VNVKYDYILVDEFQDCTNADFEIFFRMLDNPDRLILAGDLAQAVHIGTAARIPRDERMARRKFFRLEGSYRLPVRISECIKALSDKIVEKFDGVEGVSGIAPYKASPPGARPIVVYAPTLSEIGEKIRNVFQAYKIYDLKKVCVLEKDVELNAELNRIGISSETDTILSLKGLEKECVVWSTRISLEFEKEVYEFAYTILTRTSSILIIALSDNSQEVYKPIIGLLKRDRLIFWDKTTEDRFESFCEAVGNITVVDEG
jgi:DNA helicase-2/ATP-dependent DNA helicase PcrA